jgi:hypothetical protein
MSDRPNTEVVSRERIVILLNPPLRVDVVVRLMKAIAREFPEARVPFDDPAGNLVIEVDAEVAPLLEDDE